MSKSIAFVAVLALAVICAAIGATATASTSAPAPVPMSSGLSTVLVDDSFDASAFSGLAFAPERSASTESAAPAAEAEEAHASGSSLFTRSDASSSESRRTRGTRRRDRPFADDFPSFDDLDDDDDMRPRERESSARPPFRSSRPSHRAHPRRSGPLGRPWGPPPHEEAGEDCGCDGRMRMMGPRPPRGRRSEGFFGPGPSEEEYAEMMAFEEEAAARAAARAGRGGPLSRRGPARGRMSAMAADDFDDDDDDDYREPSFKERCTAFAKALDAHDWASIGKMSHKCASLTYSNQEVPFGGHWHGSKGMKVFGERIRNSMHVDSMRTRVVAVDEGYQRCVLKSNITGTFVRSGRSFRDVSLYTTIDWALGKAGRFWIVDGGNLSHMMDAYRTKAEHAVRTLSQTMVDHGPGGEVDKLVSDKAVIILGREGNRITGRTAVSQAMKAIRAAADKFGFARESIMLPHHTMRSRQCSLIASDDNNHAGACRVYNVKSRTTSFKHIDFLYRFRFDNDGKLDRMSIVEARAFSVGELMPEHKATDGSDGGDALGLMSLGGSGEVDLFGTGDVSRSSSSEGADSVFAAIAEVAEAAEAREARMGEAEVVGIANAVASERLDEDDE